MESFFLYSFLRSFSQIKNAYKTLELRKTFLQHKKILMFPKGVLRANTKVKKIVVHVTDPNSSPGTTIAP